MQCVRLRRKQRNQIYTELKFDAMSEYGSNGHAIYYVGNDEISQ
jgi:hypothetical protein